YDDVIIVILIWLVKAVLVCMPRDNRINAGVLNILMKGRFAMHCPMPVIGMPPWNMANHECVRRSGPFIALQYGLEPLSLLESIGVKICRPRIDRMIVGFVFTTI